MYSSSVETTQPSFYRVLGETLRTKPVAVVSTKIQTAPNSHLLFQHFLWLGACSYYSWSLQRTQTTRPWTNQVLSFEHHWANQCFFRTVAQQQSDASKVTTRRNNNDSRHQVWHVRYVRPRIKINASTERLVEISGIIPTTKSFDEWKERLVKGVTGRLKKLYDLWHKNAHDLTTWDYDFILRIW